MKKYAFVIVAVILVLSAVLIFYGRSSDQAQQVATDMPAADRSARMPEGHPPVGADSPETMAMDFTDIEVPDGGKSIADLYADKKSLAGKEVVVRGRVVKFTPGVMNKNWIHLRDGTGTEGANDLTVTTNVTVNLGDLVVARGVMNIDKDFGFGYAYEIIVENADVTVE
jgi:hypothetical protein